MMTVGSVRGKERFEIPVRVVQGGRVRGPAGEESEGARSAGGQVRLKPAFMERVGCPQAAQKGLRAFQSRRWREAA